MQRGLFKCEKLYTVARITLTLLRTWKKHSRSLSRAEPSPLEQVSTLMAAWRIKLHRRAMLHEERLLDGSEMTHEILEVFFQKRVAGLECWSLCNYRVSMIWNEISLVSRNVAACDSMV